MGTRFVFFAVRTEFLSELLFILFSLFISIFVFKGCTEDTLQTMSLYWNFFQLIVKMRLN
jgi:hypothetical protein